MERNLTSHNQDRCTWIGLAKVHATYLMLWRGQPCCFWKSSLWETVPSLMHLTPPPQHTHTLTNKKKKRKKKMKISQIGKFCQKLTNWWYVQYRSVAIGHSNFTQCRSFVLRLDHFRVRVWLHHCCYQFGSHLYGQNFLMPPGCWKGLFGGFMI